MSKQPGSFREQLEAMRGLSLRKKAEHIWMYYKAAIIIAALVIVAAVYGLNMIRYNIRPQVISGIFLNNATTEAGYAHLQEDYVNFTGVKDGRAELIMGRTIDFTSQPLSQEDAAVFMIIASMISARNLDYIITDEATLPYLTEQEVPLDLRELLPADVLDTLPTVTENGIPTAIRLDDTQFAKDYPFYAQNSIILVVRNAQSMENVDRFLRYLLEIE